MKYAVLVVLLAPVVLACVVPEDGMLIDASIQLCSDVHYLNKGISITGSDITVDCNGAVLKSWYGGKGISIEHSTNITVSGCSIVSYNMGIYVRNSTKVFLNDNHLVRNNIGTRFVLVSDSVTSNQDVSLGVPFEVVESYNNVLSLTNKVVSGSFCTNNFCNEGSAAAEFVKPRIEAVNLQSWLHTQLNKTYNGTLHEWVFGSLV